MRIRISVGVLMIFVVVPSCSSARPQAAVEPTRNTGKSKAPSGATASNFDEAHKASRSGHDGSQYTTPEEVAAHTEWVWDKYEGNGLLTSPWLANPSEISSSKRAHQDRYALSVVANQQQYGSLILARLSKGGPPLGYFFQCIAKDSNARSFEVRRVQEQEAEDGFKLEIVAVVFPLDYMRTTAAGPGLDLKVSGGGSNCFVRVPAFYVKGFLMKVDRLKALEQAKQ